MNPIKIIMYLFLIILLVSNMYWISQNRRNVNIIKLMQQKDDGIKSIQETQLKISLLQLESEGTHIDLSEEFIDESGKPNRIIDLVKGYPFRIILRYSQIGCHPCIDKTIKLFQQEFPDTLKNRVILLSKLTTKKDLVMLRRIHNIMNPFYQYDKNLTPIDRLNVPYFITINNEGIIAKVFIPQEGVNDKLTNDYLKYIAQLQKD
jgi:hypothetical protein